MFCVSAFRRRAHGARLPAGALERQVFVALMLDAQDRLIEYVELSPAQ